MGYELKELNSNIESLEEKLEFIKIKLSEISLNLNEIKPDSLDTMNFDDFRSIEGFRITLGTFFQVVFQAQMIARDMEGKLNETDWKLDEKVLEFEELKR